MDANPPVKKTTVYACIVKTDRRPGYRIVLSDGKYLDDVGQVDTSTAARTSTLET